MNSNKNFYIPADYMYGQPMFPTPLATNPYEIALGMVIAQIEYYLSVENLCKDIFLRRHMNSQGLIPLSTLASFNRMKALTNGNFQLVLDACKWAPSADLVGDRVRPKFNWEAWVMPFEERLPAGKDETVAEIPEIDQVPKFNAAAAVPFVPKIEGEMPPDPSSEQSKITESAKAEASS
jgi:la-related protein 1